MTSRESNRNKEIDKKRVLDEVARQRRRRKALEAFEQDNFHEDPHADLVMSKKVPKFEDDEQRGTKTTKAKKNKRRGAEHFRVKYRKTLQQLLEDERQYRPDGPNYFSIAAPPPQKPARKFCAVCGNFFKYTCTACGTYFCSVPCLNIHRDTRCLKWTA